MRLARWCLIAALALGAAGNALAQARLHHTIKDGGRALPAKIVVVPAQVRVMEVSFGGVVEPVPAWTQAATENIERAVPEAFTGQGGTSVVALPALGAAEQTELDDYRGTYLAVALDAHTYTQGPFAGGAWQFKRDKFDYTLGGGLKFLKDKTGADAALFVIGEDFVTSPGAKVGSVVLTLLTGVVIIPQGMSVLSFGLVDLESGDILWMHHTTSGIKDLKNPDEVLVMVKEVVAKYGQDK